MSKPLGMTATFQIVHPDRVQDEVWDAVCAAVNAGWEPRRFFNEVEECWTEYLREKANDVEKEFRGLRK